MKYPLEQITVVSYTEASIQTRDSTVAEYVAPPIIPTRVTTIRTTTTTRTTTLTTTTVGTTTLPPRYCIFQRHDFSDQYIKEGTFKRIYHEDESDCSEICKCGKPEELVCKTMCVDRMPCKSEFAFYNHAAPAFQAYRGRCLCYSGRFICMKPAPGDYNLPQGIFLFLGYSEVDEQQLKNHTEIIVHDVVHALQEFILREAVNGTLCTLQLFNITSENVIIAGKLSSDEVDYSMLSPKEGLAKEKCTQWYHAEKSSKELLFIARHNYSLDSVSTSCIQLAKERIIKYSDPKYNIHDFKTRDCKTVLLNQTIYYINKSKSKWINVGLYYPFEFASIVKIFGRSKQYVIFKEEELIQFHEQRENINKYFQTCDMMWKLKQIGSKTLMFEMIEEKKILRIEDMCGNEVYLGLEFVSKVWSLETVLSNRLSYSSASNFKHFYDKKSSFLCQKRHYLMYNLKELQEQGQKRVKLLKHLLKKMWMLYAEQHWTKAIDLKSAVERLYEKLCALELDADHEEIYGMEKYYTLEQCEQLRDKYKIRRKFIKKMWMLYAEQHRTKSIDLKSVVERLYEKLGALEFDTDHEAIYGMEKYYTVEQSEKLRDKY
ncbi:hypothetical protein FQA39_LY17948 [Lamprigera yunnana]|nr:hypothetical protein FQA39_LY17948 [Lamprigera yunnana]